MYHTLTVHLKTNVSSNDECLPAVLLNHFGDFFSGVKARMIIDRDVTSFYSKFLTDDGTQASVPVQEIMMNMEIGIIYREPPVTSTLRP